MALKTLKYVLLGILGLTWASGVGYGLHQIYAYSTTPGLAAEAPRHLPGATPLHLAPDRWHLMMFVHPQCPCTKASLRELERLQTALSTASVDVLIVVMTATDPQLQLDAGLGQVAQQMERTRVVADADGQLARQFGAYTSGHTLLYDRAGALRFTGGITPSRGHEGTNRGRTVIRRIVLEDAQPGEAVTPVFGCPLIEAGDLDPVARPPLDDKEGTAPCCRP